MRSPCPLQSRLDSFLAGQLDVGDESIIEQHVDICAHCQKRLEELTADSLHAPRLASASKLVEEPLTPRLRQSMADAYSTELATYNGTISGERTKPENRRPAEEWPCVPGYDVVNLLGRGGIGVVYRATDHKLKRTVALKIIRQQASPDERERLQREAEALAALRHPGVVQIFEIGEFAGRPFLALEYVAGGSLSRFAHGKPQAPRAAARLIATLAETMHVAHQRGMVHRDIKPANVLLQWDNESRIHDDLAYCQPKITDFGLVKNMSVDSGLTHTRDLLGTPNYMAPEQAGGDPETVGPACDIWALGAILYELLTGRSPFHGATALDTLMLVRQSEPVPPCRLQPKLSRDLETICMKCLEKVPSQRYASSQALADDLNRYREGQPILARPLSPVGRAIRWCRRNPAIATLSGFAAMLLTTLAIGGPIVAYRQAELRQEATLRAQQAETERQRAAESLELATLRTQQAETERQRAGQNLDLATLALEETLKQVYERIGVRPDTLRDFDQNAWEATIPYLEQLVSQEANTPESQLRKARATRQLARSFADRGERDRATALFQQATMELTRLAATDASRVEYRCDLGVCQLEHGKYLLASKLTAADGEAQLLSAAKHFENLSSEHPEVAGYRENLANTLNSLGERLMLDRSRQSEAREVTERAAIFRRQLSTEFPGKRSYVVSEFFTLLSLGQLRFDAGDSQKSGEVFARALGFAQSLSAKSPGDPQFLYLQAIAHDGLHVVHSKSGNIEKGMDHRRLSTGIYDRLTMAFPAMREYVHAAIASHEVVRRHCVQQNDWPAALEHASASLGIIQRYGAAYPKDRTFRIEELAAYRHLGTAQKQLGQDLEAEIKFASAIKMGNMLVSDPSQRDIRVLRLLAESYLEHGQLLTDRSETADAANDYEKAIALLSSPDAQPAQPETKRMLKLALQNWSESLAALGRPDEANLAKTRAGQIKDQDQ